MDIDRIVLVPASVKTELTDLFANIEAALVAECDREKCLEDAYRHLESVLEDLGAAA